ncbi:MAG TPA: helix-turn-helix domain-containing protein [Chloroflexota bacterium]|nr:helix-turn-helix domain-containing protein [Chloroflexota bacterium]
MRKFFVVRLSEAERTHLQEVSTTGRAAPSAVLPSRILLKADQSENGPGWIDARICEALDVSRATVERVRERYVLGGSRTP